jgi:hypothetical protein
MQQRASVARFTFEERRWGINETQPFLRVFAD